MHSHYGLSVAGTFTTAVFIVYVAVAHESVLDDPFDDTQPCKWGSVGGCSVNKRCPGGSTCRKYLRSASDGNCCWNGPNIKTPTPSDRNGAKRYVKAPKSTTKTDQYGTSPSDNSNMSPKSGNALTWNFPSETISLYSKHKVAEMPPGDFYRRTMLQKRNAANSKKNRMNLFPVYNNKTGYRYLGASKKNVTHAESVTSANFLNRGANSAHAVNRKTSYSESNGTYSPRVHTRLFVNSKNSLPTMQSADSRYFKNPNNIGSTSLSTDNEAIAYTYNNRETIPTAPKSTTKTDQYGTNPSDSSNMSPNSENALTWNTPSETISLYSNHKVAKMPPGDNAKYFYRRTMLERRNTANSKKNRMNLFPVYNNKAGYRYLGASKKNVTHADSVTSANFRNRGANSARVVNRKTSYSESNGTHSPRVHTRLFVNSKNSLPNLPSADSRSFKIPNNIGSTSLSTDNEAISYTYNNRATIRTGDNAKYFYRRTMLERRNAANSKKNRMNLFPVYNNKAGYRYLGASKKNVTHADSVTSANFRNRGANSARVVNRKTSYSESNGTHSPRVHTRLFVNSKNSLPNLPSADSRSFKIPNNIGSTSLSTDNEAISYTYNNRATIRTADASPFSHSDNKGAKMPLANMQDIYSKNKQTHAPSKIQSLYTENRTGMWPPAGYFGNNGMNVRPSLYSANTKESVSTATRTFMFSDNSRQTVTHTGYKSSIYPVKKAATVLTADNRLPVYSKKRDTNVQPADSRQFDQNKSGKRNLIPDINIQSAKFDQMGTFIPPSEGVADVALAENETSVYSDNRGAIGKPVNIRKAASSNNRDAYLLPAVNKTTIYLNRKENLFKADIKRKSKTDKGTPGYIKHRGANLSFAHTRILENFDKSRENMTYADINKSSNSKRNITNLPLAYNRKPVFSENSKRNARPASNRNPSYSQKSETNLPSLAKIKKTLFNDNNLADNRQYADSEINNINEIPSGNSQSELFARSRVDGTHLGNMKSTYPGNSRQLANSAKSSFNRTHADNRKSAFLQNSRVHGESRGNRQSETSTTSGLNKPPAGRRQLAYPPKGIVSETPVDNKQSANDEIIIVKETRSANSQSVFFENSGVGKMSTDNRQSTSKNSRGSAITENAKQLPYFENGSSIVLSLENSISINSDTTGENVSIADKGSRYIVNTKQNLTPADIKKSSHSTNKTAKPFPAYNRKGVYTVKSRANVLPPKNSAYSTKSNAKLPRLVNTKVAYIDKDRTNVPSVNNGTSVYSNIRDKVSLQRIAIRILAHPSKDRVIMPSVGEMPPTYFENRGKNASSSEYIQSVYSNNKGADMPNTDKGNIGRPAYKRAKLPPAFRASENRRMILPLAIKRKLEYSNKTVNGPSADVIHSVYSKNRTVEMLAVENETSINSEKGEVNMRSKRVGKSENSNKSRANVSHTDIRKSFHSSDNTTNVQPGNKGTFSYSDNEANLETIQTYDTKSAKLDNTSTPKDKISDKSNKTTEKVTPAYIGTTPYFTKILTEVLHADTEVSPYTDNNGENVKHADIRKSTHSDNSRATEKPSNNEKSAYSIKRGTDLPSAENRYSVYSDTIKDVKLSPIERQSVSNGNLRVHLSRVDKITKSSANNGPSEHMKKQVSVSYGQNITPTYPDNHKESSTHNYSRKSVYNNKSETNMTLLGHGKSAYSNNRATETSLRDTSYSVNPDNMADMSFKVNTDVKGADVSRRNNTIFASGATLQPVNNQYNNNDGAGMPPVNNTKSRHSDYKGQNVSLAEIGRPANHSHSVSKRPFGDTENSVFTDNFQLNISALKRRQPSFLDYTEVSSPANTGNQTHSDNSKVESPQTMRRVPGISGKSQLKIILQRTLHADLPTGNPRVASSNSYLHPVDSRITTYSDTSGKHVVAADNRDSIKLRKTKHKTPSLHTGNPNFSEHSKVIIPALHPERTSFSDYSPKHTGHQTKSNYPRIRRIQPESILQRRLPPTPQLPVCRQPMKFGPCTAAIPRWFYNIETKTCEQFSYGGCQGNGNNFERKEDCEKRCGVHIPPKLPLCKQPMKIGPCDAAITRWFYNLETKACEQFTYGGCEANENNFKTKDDCEKRCEVCRYGQKGVCGTIVGLTCRSGTRCRFMGSFPLSAGKCCVLAPSDDRCPTPEDKCSGTQSLPCTQTECAERGLVCCRDKCGSACKMPVYSKQRSQKFSFEMMRFQNVSLSKSKNNVKMFWLS